MRYGTRTECKKRWMIQGKRPICRMKIGYDWGYLYVALAPATGDLFAMFFTHLNKACFQIFLQEFEKHLETKGMDGKILLVGDGATAHTAQNWDDIPQMDWKRQPTACPEVNPVERFFQELRKQISNKIFETEEQIREYLKELLLKIEPQKENIKKLTLFPYIKNAIFKSE